jgi:hypothetical protein
MDKQEAKLILQAQRPNDLDATQPVFAEALALVDTDPELKAWWEAQQAFDRKVAAKLKEIPLPADLRTNILTGRKITPFAPQPHRYFWLAAAALVAILCAVGTSFHASWKAAQRVSPSHFDEAAIGFLGDNAPSLAMISPDHDKIMAWLKAQNAPIGTLPAEMTPVPTVGCQKFTVEGHAVSLVCFEMAGGGIAHLFMVAQDALSDPPSQTGPEFKQVEGWSTASWSDGRMSYMLVTQAGPDALKQLL